MFKEFNYENELYEVRFDDLEDGIFTRVDKTFVKVIDPSVELQVLAQSFVDDYNNLEYQRLRKAEYDKLNQYELQYDDLINGTETWKEAIEAIKVKYPKPEGL